MPGGAAAPDRRTARSTTSSGSSRCTATPASTSAGSGLRAGPADQRRRPDRGAPRGHRRPHLAPAPDRRPHLRPGQGDHRAAGGAVAPDGPPRRASAWSGASSRAGAAPNVIPDRGCVAGTVRILDAVAWADCEALVREVVARHRAPLRRAPPTSTTSAGVPPVVNDAESQRACSPRPCAACSAPTGRSPRPQSLGGEDFGWYLDAGPGRDGAGSAPARRAARRTTCTRATCASTSGRSASGPGCWPRRPCGRRA